MLARVLFTAADGIGASSAEVEGRGCVIISQENRIAARRGGGFTLIELLVVIAVITILAALLLPVLKNAKAQSMGIQCMSNMRQMCMGWQMYAQDNQECIVLASTSGYPGDPENAYAWTQQEEDFSDSAYNYDPSVDITVGPLYPYINSYWVYRCPADTLTINHGGQLLPRVRIGLDELFPRRIRRHQCVRRSGGLGRRSGQPLPRLLQDHRLDSRSVARTLKPGSLWTNARTASIGVII